MKTSDPHELKELISAVDTMWLIFTGLLVFFMQAGFSMLEAGSVRVKNTRSIITKTVLNPCIVGVTWWVFGWATAFGTPEPLPMNYVPHIFVGYRQYFLIDGSNYALFFFQWTFAATSATIVSGAVCERMTVIGFVVINIVMSFTIYPFIAHVAWGGGWLASWGSNGYMDFAGSGVVHLTGGTVGLVAAAVVGPRLGKFVKGKPVTIAGYSATLICLGYFVLWFGWYGFNPGSTFGLYQKSHIASVAAVNTTLASATACLTTLLIHFVLERSYDLPLACNGGLAGLVAITAPCAFVQVWFGVLIAFVAAFVYYASSKLLLKLRVDDPVDAAPIHCFCGLWGALSVGLFADRELTEQALGHPVVNYGAFLGGGGTQLLTQFVGTCFIVGWSAAISLVPCLLLRWAKLLRVKPHEEVGGERGEGAWVRLSYMDHGRLEVFQFGLAQAPAGLPGLPGGE